MATTPNDPAGLKKYIDDMKAQGKTESTSKSLAKAVIKLKQFSPENFDLEAGGGNEAILQRGVEDPDDMKRINDMSSASSPSFSGSSSFGASSGGTSDINLQSIYDEAMNSPELQGLQTELETKKSALTDALTNINDNPFYSEATRTGKIAKLNEQAGREIADIEDMINSRKADAQVKVNIATQQYNIDDNNYKNNLSKLNLLISSGALLNASGQDISQIAMATGMSTDMVRGIQAQMEKNLIQPQVITSTDNAGNVTVAVVDGATGNIISQNSLGNVGKASTTKAEESNSVESLKPQMMSVLQSVSGGDGYVSPDTWARNLKAWVAERGGSKSSQDEFVGLFNNFVNSSHSEDYFGYDDYFGQ